MRRLGTRHNDDYPKDTTRRTERAYTFEVVINNERECTKAVRMPGPALPTSYVKLETDSAYVRVIALDMVAAITEAFELANAAWHDLAENEVIAPCA